MRLWDLYEDIPQPPRNLRLFVKNRIKEVAGLKEAIEELRALELRGRFGEDAMDDAGMDLRDELGEGMEEAVRAIEDLTSGWNRPGESIEDYIRNLVWTDELFDKITKQGIPEHESVKLSEYIKSNIPHIIRYASDLQERFKESLEPLKRFSSALPRIKEYLSEYHLNPENAEPQEIKEVENWLKALELGGGIAQYVERVIAAIPKFQGMVDWWSAHAYGQKPKPKEQETLYHVTAFADEIARQGFQAQKPRDEERYGLGSYSSGVGISTLDTHISTTHDIHYARQIMRAMRELVLIANGQLRKHHILRWIADEGVDLKSIVMNLRGIPTDKYGAPLLDQYPDTPEHTAELYKGWMWMNKVGRENPVFANIEKAVAAFKGRKPEDVGIIKMLANMDDPSIEYFPAEKEWRVPPSSVLNVERVQ